ncbi:unnamed protein product [Paramecium octaurelia]|uniref:Uncharacterized protein n=1 Tax=Paramecium octaurelia TaxID=43137 RepID=A0A8S1XLK7_PAROT|nr:unnamed protein product [Paramecium octaurelia]CAD8201818.1 unnamed protein product [Paramecium octaurelia]
MDQKVSQHWIFCCALRGRKEIAKSGHYEINLKKIGETNRVEEFYNNHCFLQKTRTQQQYYDVMKGLQTNCEYCLNGRIWIITLRKRKMDY